MATHVKVHLHNHETACTRLQKRSKKMTRVTIKKVTRVKQFGDVAQSNRDTCPNWWSPDDDMARLMTWQMMTWDFADVADDGMECCWCGTWWCGHVLTWHPVTWHMMTWHVIVWHSANVAVCWRCILLTWCIMTWHFCWRVAWWRSILMMWQMMTWQILIGCVEFLYSPCCFLLLLNVAKFHIGPCICKMFSNPILCVFF